MKMVIAYLPPFAFERVARALQAIPEVSGASFTEIRGFGRERGKLDSEPLVTELAQFGTFRRLRVETIIADELEDRVVSAIRDAVCADAEGGGKIYVAAIERALNIRAGRQGEAAP